MPAGSLAMLDDAAHPYPSFHADVIGQYRFTLVVDDTFKVSEPSSITITAVNDDPIAVAAPGRKLYAGTSFVLDGSASSDANGDPLTYEWTVTSAPAGSTAVPAAPTSATTTFVPDVHGPYELALTVDDGHSSSTPATVALDVYFPLTSLPFMRDAEYSAALDRVVIVGVAPNALYLYDPVTGSSASVPLSQEPFALSLAPDGLSAVVGHSNLVSVVNLQTRAVTLTKATSVGTLDIVHGGNGYAYVFPSAGTGNAIQNVPLSSSAITQGGLAPLMRAKRVPGALTLYAAFGTSSGIYRYDIVSNSATFTHAVGSPACDELWISDDGARIFTGCGTVYSTSNVEAQDMQPLGAIPGVTSVADLAESTSSNDLLVIPGGGETVRFHDSATLMLDHEMTLPRFLVNDTGYTGYGRYVFLRADDQSFTVIQNTSDGVSGMGTFSL